MSVIALNRRRSVWRQRWKRTVVYAIATTLLALSPNKIAFQDLGALLVRQPPVTERWQRHLISSAFGNIRVAAISLPTPLGTTMTPSSIYAVAIVNPADVGHLIAEQSLGVGDATASMLEFPEPDRKAKADLLTSRPREQMPATSLLLAAKPEPAIPVPKTNGFARSLTANPTLAAFDTPVLAPIAFVHFCSRYPRDCKVNSNDGDRTPLSLTEEKLAELAQINRDVNNSITPQVNREGVSAEKWLVRPDRGDCNDYAVTKRHELLARGWPSHSLLLAEVMLNSGEHHLVLVVRTREGDLVLDNLNSDVRPASQTKYQWVRAQKVENPRFWSTIDVGRADRVVGLASGAPAPRL
jgi:predicted transglutaminase-like cysteine proteinase